MIHAGAVLAILFAMTATADQPTKTGPSQPRGEEALLIVRRSGQCGSWRVAIYESAYATAESTDTCSQARRDSSRLIKLRAEVVRSVITRLESSRFFELPQSVEPLTIVTDDDFLSIRASLGTRKHEVMLQGAQMKLRADAIDRFKAVWGLVEELVPEPTTATAGDRTTR
jgi:hypothetical protein